MNAAQIHLVVATLLVTVTFAAGFTLPGGFENDHDSPHKGMAILVKKPAFCAFVVTDAIAFVCSAGAVFSYFVMAANHRPTTKEELRVLVNIYRVATILQFLSMSAVVIAFVTGLYATLSHSDPEKSRENTMKAAQIHLVVAALIMTVTFTAGFTLPGGFDSDRVSPDKGMAILLKSTSFGVFVVTNAIAFTSSAAAVFTHFAMGASITYVPGSVAGLMVTELEVILRLYKIATYLQFVAMYAVVIAFVTGMYATLAHSVGLAATVCVIGCISFVLYVLVIVVWLQLE
ncbi:hypothetical protein KY284_024657 [Solanum tuberosum]|nr:hypothetical protein KY284_024657 [Solanum tuberosum]